MKKLFPCSGRWAGKSRHKAHGPYERPTPERRGGQGCRLIEGREGMRAVVGGNCRSKTAKREGPSGLGQSAGQGAPGPDRHQDGRLRGRSGFEGKGGPTTRCLIEGWLWEASVGDRPGRAAVRIGRGRVLSGAGPAVVFRGACRGVPGRGRRGVPGRTRIAKVAACSGATDVWVSRPASSTRRRGNGGNGRMRRRHCLSAVREEQCGRTEEALGASSPGPDKASGRHRAVAFPIPPGPVPRRSVRCGEGRAP